MKNIRTSITELNVARSSDCSKEKSEEIKGIIQDLLPYAELEEELGIDLLTLFKALKQGYIWYDEEKYKIECLYMKPRIHLYVADGVGGCYMEDYGKTWALTKEELETK